jgi:uncharacterized protein YdeI (YjbR/CyaY-like superfamily)
LWTHNITVPPDLVAALDDDDRAKAASESLGRSERYAVILPLLKAKTPQQRTERLRVTMAGSCYPDRGTRAAALVAALWRPPDPSVR